MLHQVMSSIEEDLADLTDQIPIPVFQQYRNAAIACLKQMALSPQLFDDGFANPARIDGDPVYMALLQTNDRGTWEQNTLRQGLLYSLLLSEGGVEESAIFLEAIKYPPVLTSIDIPPSSPVTRLSMIATFCELQSQQKSHFAKLAVAIGKIVDAILPHTSTPENFLITADQRTAIVNAVDAGKAGRRPPTASEDLKKLVISLNTRIGQSLRHLHAPAVMRVPDTDQVTKFLQWVHSGDPHLGSFAIINTLLSGFAGTLLDAPSLHRVKIEGDRYSALLKIRAPDLEKKSSLPSGEDWMAIDPSISLPLPLRILSSASQLKLSPGYSFDAAKLRLRHAITSWKKDHGVDFTLGRLHLLLPAQLGQAGYFDNTLLHLLGLKEITARDAGIHYFSPLGSEVVRRYRQAVETLSCMTGQGDWMEDGWTECPQQNTGFGSSARPSRDALIRLVSQLKEAAQRGRGRLSLENHIRSFNAEAAYLTVLFLASTGARPVESVFPESDHWSVDSRTLLLSEKDSLLYRSTRQLPINEKLLQGVEKFTERKRALEVSLGRRFDQRLVVFLVDAAGNPLYPTVPNLKALVPGLADHWPWPNDMLRHHFRSRLWELGCPSAILDRAMGHLSKSQTPDAMFSMSPIWDVTACATPFITQLINEIGF